MYLSTVYCCICMFLTPDPSVPRPAVHSYPRSQQTETRWIQPGEVTFHHPTGHISPPTQPCSYHPIIPRLHTCMLKDPYPTLVKDETSVRDHKAEAVTIEKKDNYSLSV